MGIPKYELVGYSFEERLEMARAVAMIIHQLNDIKGSLNKLRGDIKRSEFKLRSEIKETENRMDARMDQMAENNKHIAEMVERFESRIADIETRLNSGEISDEDLDKEVTEIEQMIDDAMLDCECPE